MIFNNRYFIYCIYGLLICAMFFLLDYCLNILIAKSITLKIFFVFIPN